MELIVGKMVKRLRQEKGVTQEQLGCFLGISCQAVSKWENGPTMPDISLLPEIARLLGVTTDDLFSISIDDHMAR